MFLQNAMAQQGKRFVIQEHTRGADVHWDFMLESGDSLQTYRLDRPAEEIPYYTVKAVKIFSHPLKFLTYEGPVNNGTGNVRITEAGTYQVTAQEHNLIELKLNGSIVKGKFTLTHVKDDKWQLATDAQLP